MNRTEDGRTLKMMPIVDEYSRECLSIEAQRSISAQEVVKTLASLFAHRGEPALCEMASADEDLTKELESVIALSMADTENGVRPEQARVAFKIDDSISGFLKPKNGADIQMLSRGALSSPKKKAVRRSLTAKS
jgi:hypothetical protein